MRQHNNNLVVCIFFLALAIACILGMLAEGLWWFLDEFNSILSVQQFLILQLSWDLVLVLIYVVLGCFIRVVSEFIGGQSIASIPFWYMHVHHHTLRHKIKHAMEECFVYTSIHFYVYFNQSVRLSERIPHHSIMEPPPRLKLLVRLQSAERLYTKRCTPGFHNCILDSSAKRTFPHCYLFQHCLMQIVTV